jgi:hypothetical protein
MKGRIGPQSFAHSGLASEVIGLNGSGRYGFEFKIPHGKNATRRLRLDVQPEVILRIAAMMNRCGPETAPGHVLWHLERPDVEAPCDQCDNHRAATSGVRPER